MKNKAKIIVSVTNDLSTDMRVHKVCTFLIQQGYIVTLVGRKLPDSMVLSRDYKTKRFNLLFNKNWLFYAAYNLRLFFYLLFKSHTHLLANDLDTLLANFLVSKIKNTQLIYDSHEYFTEVPELAKNKIAKTIWLKIESYIFPKLKNVYTVNTSIATIYEKKYGVDVKVIQNVPFLYTKTNSVPVDFPIDKKVIILQGAGINIDRGAEEALLSMSYLPHCVLLIIGKGDAIANLKKLALDYTLADRIIFLPRMNYNTMMHYTQNAHVGLTLDKDTNLNYKYSLPNKLFDYIQAQIPVVASGMIEVKQIIEEQNIGIIIKSHAAQDIASAIEKALTNDFSQGLKIAALKYNWENESEKLKMLFPKIHS